MHSDVVSRLIFPKFELEIYFAFFLSDSTLDTKYL